MLTTLWGTVGSRLGERWLLAALPVLAVLTAGVGAALTSVRGRAMVSGRVDAVAGAATATQLLLVAAGLFGVAAAVVVVDRLLGPALALVTGQSRVVPRAVVTWGTRRAGRLATRLDDAYQPLAARERAGTADARDLADLARLDARLRRLPEAGHRSHTGLGNQLLAADLRVRTKYGLRVGTVWPHFWLLLPEVARQDVAIARRAVDRSTTAAVCSVALLAFTPWAWWIGGVTVLVWVLAVRVWLPGRVEVHCTLVEACFDLHRSALYTAVRWPLPTDLWAEPQEGDALTHYLARGMSGREPLLVPAATGGS